MDDRIEDILYRDTFVDRIVNEIEYVGIKNSNLFIMIDGEWGCGKTFILNMIKDKIKDRYNIIEYNCWENSFYSDPLIAIISATTEQLNKFSDINELGVKLMNKFGYFKNVAIGTTGNISQIALNSVDVTVDGAYKSLESYIKDFKKQLEKFNDNNQGKDNKRIRVIIVDELDRCLPEYAIKVLERLYLLFKDVPNTIVLIGNNNCQLTKSIKIIFGNQVSVNDYLKKFIDRTFTIDYQTINPNNLYNKYIDYFCLFSFDFKEEKNDCFKFISIFLSKFNPREQRNIFNSLMKKHEFLFLPKECEIEICIYEILCAFTNLSTVETLMRNVKSSHYDKNEHDEFKKQLCKLNDLNYVTYYDDNNYIFKALSLYIYNHFQIFHTDIKNHYSSCYYYTRDSYYKNSQKAGLIKKLLLFEK